MSEVTSATDLLNKRLDLQSKRMDTLVGMLRIQQAAIVNLIQITQELNPGNAIPPEVQELINDWESRS